MREPRVHFGPVRWPAKDGMFDYYYGRAVCGAPRSAETTEFDPNVTCSRCLAWLIARAAS